MATCFLKCTPLDQFLLSNLNYFELNFILINCNIFVPLEIVTSQFWSYKTESILSLDVILYSRWPWRKIILAIYLDLQADEKTRRDLFKLRSTWSQYFPAKILHDLDVAVNKHDPGWPISPAPPPSPSIHINPKFLKKVLLQSHLTIPFMNLLHFYHNFKKNV